MNTLQKMKLTTKAKERKQIPITTGVLDYFPLAIAEIASLSLAGNQQHNSGKPLHWDRSKSTDHADCIARHLIDRYAIDSDGKLHAAKLAWRALAFLQTLLEEKENNSDAETPVVDATESSDNWIPRNGETPNVGYRIIGLAEGYTDNPELTV